MTGITAAIEKRLAVRADPGAFNDAELARCDEPVRRYFRAAIAPGTPLARVARLRMYRSIKIAKRWVPFTAQELLAPLHGYVWPATVAGGLLRGADRYVDGVASVSWKLLGLVPVIRSRGPDPARSATGRAAAEGIWLPTALPPRYGVDWKADDDEHLVARLLVAREPLTLRITIDGRRPRQI